MGGLLDWFSPTRIMIVLGLALALIASVLGFGAVRYHAGEEAAKQKYEAKILKLNADAALDLAAATLRALGLERKLADFKAKEEMEYENRRIASRGAGAALDRAAGTRGVFVDPNGRRCSGGGAQAEAVRSAASSPVDTAGTGGELSVQLSDLLRAKLRRADEINDAYAICRTDAIGVRKIMEEGTQEGH